MSDKDLLEVRAIYPVVDKLIDFGEKAFATAPKANKEARRLIARVCGVGAKVIGIIQSGLSSRTIPSQLFMANTKQLMRDSQVALLGALITATGSLRTWITPEAEQALERIENYDSILQTTSPYDFPKELETALAGVTIEEAE
ncbi:MAG: hypothetical protein ACYCX4_11050 [Bacillota bacterium]